MTKFHRFTFLAIFLASALPIYTLMANSEKTNAFELHRNGDNYTLKADNAPLADVVAKLGVLASLELKVDPSLDMRVTADLEDVTLEKVLAAVSSSRAMVYERTDDDQVRMVQARLTSQQEEVAPAAVTSSGEGDLARARASEVPPSMLTNTRRSLHELRSGEAQALLFSSAILDTKALVEEGRGLDIPAEFRADPESQVFIVQFNRAVSSADREALEALGATVSHFVPNRAYAVTVAKDQVESVRNLPGVYVVEPYHPYYKMSYVVRERLMNNDAGTEAASSAPFKLMTFAEVDIEDDLAAAGIAVQRVEGDGRRQVMTIETDVASLKKILKMDGVQWVEPYTPAAVMNDLGVRRLRVPSLRKAHPTLTGEGVTVAVTDSGVDYTHQGFSDEPGLTSTNFNTRISYYEYRPGPATEGLPGDVDGHGSHVAGSILGNGALSSTVISSPGSSGPPYATNQFAGVAPRAKLVMLEDFNSIPQSEQARIGYQQGARISNNSWGYPFFFEYGTDSALWDSLVRDADSTSAGNQDYIVFFSAGNSGNGNSDGTGASANTVSMPGNAKNVITMGALEQLRNANNIMGVFFGDQQYFSTLESDSDWQVASYSSRGPVSGTDLRVKPDLVAPGSFVLSVQSHETSPDDFTSDFSRTDYRFGNVNTGTNYAYFSGTSMSAPLGAGSAALIYQHLTNTLGNPPSAAMMKAILVAGARTVNSLVYKRPVWDDDLAMVEDGWGLIDVARSIDGPRVRATDEVILRDQSQNQPLQTDETFTEQVVLGNDEGGLRIVMAYTDRPGTPGAGVQLVNNLDLVIFGPNGAIYRGNQFDSDGVHARRFNNTDNILYDQFNNVEAVTIPAGGAGTYSIRVYGRQVPEGPQDFALVIQKGIGYQGRTGGNFPSLALDTNGYPVVAYSFDASTEGNQSNLTKQIYVRRWVGPYGDSSELGQWKRIEDQWFGIRDSLDSGGISRTLENSEFPSVTVNGENIYVAWEEGTQSDPQSAVTNQRVFLKQYDGANWVELAASGQGFGVSKNTNGYDAVRPVVAVMGDGSPVVAWLQKGFAPNLSRVFLARWNGSSWVGLANSHIDGLPTPAATKLAEYLSIAINSSGNPVVAFKETTNPDGIVVLQWTGAAWGNISPADSTPFIDNPKIAAGPGNTLALAWVQTFGTAPGIFQTYQVYAARYNGSWSAVGGSQTFPGVSAATNLSERPIKLDVGVGLDSAITVVWQGGTVAAERTILARKWTVGAPSWTDISGSSVAPGITKTFDNYSTPDIAIDRLGRPVVVFVNTLTVTNAQEIQTYTVVSDRSPPQFNGLQTAVGGTNNEVRLTWLPATDDVSTTIVYQIYRSATSVACGVVSSCDVGLVFSNLIATVTNTTTFTVTGLVNDRLYCFGVRARDASGLVDDNTVTRRAGPSSLTGDGDNDCLTSALELIAGTSPCDSDSDDDGMKDGWEWFYSTNNVAHTNAFAMDPLDDGKINYRDFSAGDVDQSPFVDVDNDGASTYEEYLWYVAYTSICVNATTNLVSPDPTKADTDGDLLADGWEMLYGLNPVVPNSSTNDADMDGLTLLDELLRGTDPNKPDTDRDGLYDGSWYPGNPFGTTNLFEGNNGSNPVLVDSDFDGLDDGVEVQQGSSPIRAASIVSFLTDGDLYQLGWTNSAITNFVSVLVDEDFENKTNDLGQITRTNWTHNAPNGAMPFDFWHLSTAEPGVVATNGIEYFNAHSTNVAYRMANDPSKTNVNATYDIGGGVQSLIQNALNSPRFNATNQTALFVQWNEYYETEPNADFVTVQARGGSNLNWFSISSVISGQSKNANPVSGSITNDWVYRTADLSRFAGMTNVQVRFLFSAQNSINNNYKGWWVDDVAVYGTRIVSGWVRDSNGKPIEKASVYVIGRGGISKVIDGQITIPPGKVIAEGQTAKDGSFSINNVFPGKVYVKALAPGYAAEFYDGDLFTGAYAFGAGLRPGVADIDLVSTAGYVNVSSVNFTNAYFELERGLGRAYLGVALNVPGGSRFPVYIDGKLATVWNGSNTTLTASNIAYRTFTNISDLVINRPDWETNAVAPRMMTELAPGDHWLQVGTNFPPVLPTFNIREGEKFLVNFSTNLAGGSVLVNAEGSVSYPIWLDGRIIGNTPLRLNASVGPHKFSIVQTNLARVAIRSVNVVAGPGNFVTFASNDLFGATGSTLVRCQDVFGSSITDAVVYVNGGLYATNQSLPLLVTNLLFGEHFIQVSSPGFRLTDQRSVRILSIATNETLFTLADSDADFDLVGDRTEYIGYTNVFRYSRSDDIDQTGTNLTPDGLSNLLEFEIFRQSGVRLNPFDPDSDDDGMSDGQEVGYDGFPDRFAISTIAEQAVQGTNVLRSFFAGKYLSGIDNFGGPGQVIAAIECDRFVAATLSHSNDAMPSKNQALTVFQGIPQYVTPVSISEGHFKASGILADTRPDIQDTDGDSLWDGFEYQYGYINSILLPGTSNRIMDPLECGGAGDDPDADGLSNYEEFLGPDRMATTNLDWTDPTKADTDDDGMPDGWEYFYGLNPSDAGDRYLDPDNDGLVNLGEFNLGSNPRLYDTDADGLPDGQEAVFGTDPQDVDTDNDGLLDGREVWDRDLDGVPDGGFFPNWTPGADMDNDGYVDGPTDRDTDGDGMPDGWEVFDSFGRIRPIPLNPSDPSDADDDYDGDGLSNLQEYLVQDSLYGNPPSDFSINPIYQNVIWDYGTDPFNSDSDGDGMPDGWEVIHGLHPMDPIPDFRQGGISASTNTYRYSGTPYVLDIEGDVDGDGLWNLREFRVRYQLGVASSNITINSASTHPWIVDTDMDGLGDGEEDRAFALNPVVQDSDGDRLMDGTDVNDRYGEVWSTTNTAVTNHFDRALNDLWSLTIDPVALQPVWSLVVPSNGPPEGRWGAQAVYNPVIERQLIPTKGFCPFGHPVGTIDSETANAIMDNRQLVVMGGRDGVTRFNNAWQYNIASNQWIMATNTSLLGELSEFGAAIIFGHDHAGSCEGHNPGPPNSGRPSIRPWMTLSSAGGLTTVAPYGLGALRDLVSPNAWHANSPPDPEAGKINDISGDNIAYETIAHHSLSRDYTMIVGGWTAEHKYPGGPAVFNSADDTNSFVVSTGCVHFASSDRWIPVIPPIEPAGLKSFAMAYAYRGLAGLGANTNLFPSGVAVVFGGMSGNDILQNTYRIQPVWTLATEGGQPSAYPLNEIKTFTVSPEVSPPARWGSHMLYEPNLRVMVLFGGFDSTHKPLSDLWVYDGVTWSEVRSFNTLERPQPRGGANFAYYGGFDYNRGWSNYVVNGFQGPVLFGGTDGKVCFDDLWILQNLSLNVTGFSAEWKLLHPVGEERRIKPSPRAFASMAWAQNSQSEPVWPRSGASGEIFLFGGRSGALPTGLDTDFDLVQDGTEYELGGITAGRDPSVNKLIETNSLTETTPFAFLRIGPTRGNPRIAIANFERADISPESVEASLPEQTDRWYHQYSVEFPFNVKDEWQLGRPIPDSLGPNGAPPYAYSGRWVFGTDLDGAYQDDTQMELLSPLIQLTIPPVDATSTNYTTRFNLIFHEWLDLADSNDIVRVEMIRPVLGSEIAKRIPSPDKPIIILVPNRNSAYNTTGEWRRVTAPIEISANETNVYFKFFFKSDASGNAGGWYIDDVAIIQGSEINGTYTNGTDVVLLGENYNGQIQDQTITYNNQFQFGLLPLGNYQLVASGVTNALILNGPNLETNVTVSVMLPSVAFTQMNHPPIVVTWSASNSFIYSLDFTTNLLSGTWSNLSIQTSTVDGTLSYTDTFPSVERVYRVSVTNSP